MPRRTGSIGRRWRCYEEIGDRLGQASALGGLGEVARAQDRCGEAERDFASALSLYLEIGLPQAALSLSILEGQDALAQAAAHRRHGEHHHAAEACALARLLMQWGQRALGQTNDPVLEYHFSAFRGQVLEQCGDEASPSDGSRQPRRRKARSSSADDES